MSPRSLGGVLALALLLPMRALAVTPPQARCLDTMDRYALRVAGAATRGALACVRATDQRGAAARDCLPAAVDGSLATTLRRLAIADARWCGRDGAQRPDAGYAGAAALAGAVRAAVVGVVGDVLGPDLPFVPPARRPDARCQWVVVTGATRLLRALWTDAVGADGTAVTSATRRLADDARRECGRTATPLASLFALPCPGLATTSDLIACVESVARRHFHRGRAAGQALAVPCDLTDDGDANLSCVPAALEEHVLNRLGYGPDPWTLGRLRALGVPGYVEEQLHPETIADDAVDALLADMPSLGMPFLDLRIHYPNRVVPGQPQSGDVLKELQRAKVLRAVASHRQLEQVLTDFWFNHFNILATDRRDYDISPYERIAIRPNVLGRFRDLLLAVVRSPGMGDYLDGRRNRVDGINENFSRELLELHTIGVDGGYTETDVGAVARAFTGWKEDQAAPDGFEFFPAWHDPGAKQVLGLTLPANGGYEDGVAIIDLLATHPRTAARIARKLVVRFVSETPPQRLVQAATDTFLATGGDLRAVMRTILLSPEFLDDAANRRSKVKRPLHLMASLARATHADPATLGLDRIRRRVRELGEDLYGFAAPPGYPDVSGYWTGAGTMLLRFNFVELAARGVDGIVPVFPTPAGATSAVLVDTLAADLFLAGVSDATRDTAIAFADLFGTAGTPGRTAETAAVLLSSPEFLVH